MKLILAIVNNEDTPRATDALMKSGFFVTRLSTTGGFLLRGNTSLLIGTDEESFMRELRLVLDDNETRERLAVLASDQSRMYSWGTTAWQLWEIHANI